MSFSIDFELETDGRWIAEIVQLPGVLAYGATREDAQARVEALAQRVLAD
jgi:predicted RNase H-like HicB family nuclease